MVDTEIKARLALTGQASTILAQMTLSEKVKLMTGNSNLDLLREGWRQTKNFALNPYTTPGCESRNIPPLRFSDGSRGAVCGSGRNTCFPATVCRGATFDAELEYQIGSAIAKELRVYNVNVFSGVCANLPYNPGWGRSQDVYGEDSFHIGHMASALIRGIQHECVMACVKHYAFNSIENNRFKIDIYAEPRTEQEVFLPHFKDCIDAGAACVMGAYNKYRGDRCCESHHLITDILKNDWKFDGFVVSEWFSAIDDTKKALEAGLDMEMPIPRSFGNILLNMVQQKIIPESMVDDAALRIIRTVLAFENARQNSRKHYSEEIIGCKAHAALALKAARDGITLLKNKNNILPFNPGASQKVVVLGRLALYDNLGDHGSQRVFPAHTVTPLCGISRLLPRADIIYYGRDNLSHARSLADNADAVIILVGYDHTDEGEYMTTASSTEYQKTMGGDRSELTLRKSDFDMITTVGPVNEHTAVVMIGGSTIIPTDWIDSVPAVLMAYYPGQEGGTALAEILFGKVNPSGRLPFVIPYHQTDLPLVDWNADTQHYGYYHGYAKLEKDSITPLFPFGFGLSYTTFSVSDPQFSADDIFVSATCIARNTGNLTGDAVLQMYVGFDHSAIDRPHKVLRGFRRVKLCPGESRAVTIKCPIEKLKYYDESSHCFRLEHMVHQVYIGTSSADKDLLCGYIPL